MDICFVNASHKTTFGHQFAFFELFSFMCSSRVLVGIFFFNVALVVAYYTSVSMTFLLKVSDSFWCRSLFSMKRHAALHQLVYKRARNDSAFCQLFAGSPTETYGHLLFSETPFKHLNTQFIFRASLLFYFFTHRTKLMYLITKRITIVDKRKMKIFNAL